MYCIPVSRTVNSFIWPSSWFFAACEKYNVDLIGGDTSTSQKGFIISVTAIGEVAPEKFVKRSTAQKGDLLCVSGFLGGGLSTAASNQTFMVVRDQTNGLWCIGVDTNGVLGAYRTNDLSATVLTY